jgi:quercetin dioxygenase-like cupin family protein
MSAMFRGPDDHDYIPALPGIRRKTQVFGANTLLTEFRMDEGSSLPRHAHPHEQTGYLVSGRIRLLIGDEAFDATPGASWSIGGGVEHGAEVLEDAVAIEVFAPLREDYLPE